MPNRIPSDHSSIVTIRARVERHGGGRRLALPESTIAGEETTFRLILADRTCFARIDRSPDDAEWITGVYDSSRGADDPSQGTDRLGPWLEEHDRAPGASVELDVIEAGFLYGLRVPGTRTVYEAVGKPDDSLASIARNLEDESSR